MIDVCKQSYIFVNVLKENPAEIPNMINTVVNAVKNKQYQRGVSV